MSFCQLMINHLSANILFIMVFFYFFFIADSYQMCDYSVALCWLLAVPARIVNISADVSVNEGSNVSLMCLAIGRPEPSILWKFRSSKGDGRGKGSFPFRCSAVYRNCSIVNHLGNATNHVS